MKNCNYFQSSGLLLDYFRTWFKIIKLKKVFNIIIDINLKERYKAYIINNTFYFEAWFDCVLRRETCVLFLGFPQWIKLMANYAFGCFCCDSELVLMRGA